MRISDSMRYQRPARDIARAQQRLARAEEQVSSTRRLLRPSDDPVGAAASIRARSELGQVAGYVENSAQARTWLAVGETALGQATDILQLVRERTIQAGSDVLGAADRSSIASEIEGVRETLLQLANTRVDNCSVFAGSQTDQPAFDVAGVYQGDDRARSLAIGEQTEVAVNISGREAFAANVDAFALLDRLAGALRANDGAAVRDSLGDVDLALEGIIAARGQAGLRLARLDRADDQLSQLQLGEKTRLSRVEDADMVAAISDLQLQEQALQGALGAASKVVQRSLLDFLG